MKKVYVIIILYQRVKDRASRMQSESLLSGFAEAQPIFERSSMIALASEKSNSFELFRAP